MWWLGQSPNHHIYGFSSPGKVPLHHPARSFDDALERLAKSNQYAVTPVTKKREAKMKTRRVLLACLAMALSTAGWSSAGRSSTG